MKTSLKLLMPVLAFALASAGAAKSVAVETADAKMPAPIPAYVQNPTPFVCPDVTAECSTVNTHVNCMSIEQPLKRAYLKNGSNQCSVELWKVL